MVSINSSAARAGGSVVTESSLYVGVLQNLMVLAPGGAARRAPQGILRSGTRGYSLETEDPVRRRRACTSP